MKKRYEQSQRKRSRQSSERVGTVRQDRDAAAAVADWGGGQNVQQMDVLYQS